MTAEHQRLLNSLATVTMISEPATAFEFLVFHRDFGAGFKVGTFCGSRTGWLGSSWQQPAIPQCGGLGSWAVALRLPTPATPICQTRVNQVDMHWVARMGQFCLILVVFKSKLAYSERSGS